MRAVSVCSLVAALGLASAALTAQTKAAPVPSVLTGQTPGLACPVHFAAERYGLTATLRQTAKGEAGSFAQSLRLNFASADASEMVRAVVVVYGANPVAQIVPLAQDQAGQKQSDTGRSETFVLTRTKGRFDPAEEIVTETVPLVQRIEITEIEFKDGSVWRPSREARCSTAPSPFVLVNATAR
jgi:hypothetical protein